METTDNLLALRKLVEDRLGSAIVHKTGFLKYDEPGIIVRLTDELADHIIQMYYATDWIELMDDACICLPENSSTGELDEDAFKAQIGRHIIISLYGDPWTDILEAPAFVKGARIDFSDRLLGVAADTLYTMNCNGDFDDIVEYLSLAVLAMSADGVPNTYLSQIVRAELEKK